LPPRSPSYCGLWTAPELTSGLCVFASATFKGSNRSMRVRPPASTDTWLGLSCDSTPAEYFQAPIQGGKPRFLAPTVGLFSICLCKLRPTQYKKWRKQPLAKHFRRKTKFPKM